MTKPKAKFLALALGLFLSQFSFGAAALDFIARQKCREFFEPSINALISEDQVLQEKELDNFLKDLSENKKETAAAMHQGGCLTALVHLLKTSKNTLIQKKIIIILHSLLLKKVTGLCDARTKIFQEEADELIKSNFIFSLFPFLKESDESFRKNVFSLISWTVYGSLAPTEKRKTLLSLELKASIITYLSGLLQSTDPEDQELGLWIIKQRLTISYHKDINSLFSTLLYSEPHPIQEKIIDYLFNYTLRIDNKIRICGQDSIIRTEIPQALETFISSDNKALQVKVLILLTRLAYKQDNEQQVLEKRLPKVILTLQEGDENAYTMLSNLRVILKYNNGKRSFIDVGGLQILMDLAETTAKIPELQKEIGSLFEEISSRYSKDQPYQEDFRSAFVSHLINPLLKAIEEKELDESRAAVSKLRKTMQNPFYSTVKSSVIRASFGGNRCIEILLRKLDSSDDDTMRQEGTKFLLLISLFERHTLARSENLVILRNLLSTGNETIQGNILDILYKIAVGSRKHQKKMFKAKIMPVILELAENANESVQKGARKLLGLLPNKLGCFPL